MCLAVPALIKSVCGQTAEVKLSGITRLVSIVLTPDVKAGDYVLIHTGYAISVINEDEAQETINLIGDILSDD